MSTGSSSSILLILCSPRTVGLFPARTLSLPTFHIGFLSADVEGQLIVGDAGTLYRYNFSSLPECTDFSMETLSNHTWQIFLPTDPSDKPSRRYVTVFFSSSGNFFSTTSSSSFSFFYLNLSFISSAHFFTFSHLLFETSRVLFQHICCD